MPVNERLLELASRCEQATGPDRELDIAIAEKVLGWGKWPKGPAPKVTASLDAAMTLVPEDGRIELKSEFSDGPDTPLEWWAALAPGYMQQRVRTEGRTAALALCAAALKARASTAEE